MSAQNPGLQLLDAKLLLPGQHFIVEGGTGVTSPTVQVSIQPQPKLATKEKRKWAVEMAQLVHCYISMKTCLQHQRKKLGRSHSTRSPSTGRTKTDGPQRFWPASLANQWEISEDMVEVNHGAHLMSSSVTRTCAHTPEKELWAQV